MQDAMTGPEEVSILRRARDVLFWMPELSKDTLVITAD